MSIRNLRFCIGLIASPEGSKQPLKPKIKRYPKIDQVNLWCLLQRNVSCGRSQNHQAYQNKTVLSQLAPSKFTENNHKY